MVKVPAKLPSEQQQAPQPYHYHQHHYTCDLYHYYRHTNSYNPQQSYYQQQQQQSTQYQPFLEQDEDDCEEEAKMQAEESQTLIKPYQSLDSENQPQNENIQCDDMQIVDDTEIVSGSEIMSDTTTITASTQQASIEMPEANNVTMVTGATTSSNINKPTGLIENNGEVDVDNNNAVGSSSDITTATVTPCIVLATPLYEDVGGGVNLLATTTASPTTKPVTVIAAPPIQQQHQIPITITPKQQNRGGAMTQQPLTHHHHMHPRSTIPAPGGAAWPIVEPVFHFGPGFEHQSHHYCPTHSQGPHEHVVLFHVNPGVSVTFQIAGNREIIRGPVTVPMVSQSGSPPIPMPVQVPPGHVMQQIVDENGTLRHVILSTAQHQQIHGQASVQGVHNPNYGQFIANGTTSHYYTLPGGFPAPGPHFHPIQGGHLQPQPMTHSPHSPSPPTNYHKDERSQRQHEKLVNKFNQKQREMSSTMSTPAHSPSPRKNDLNGLRRNVPRNGASSVGTSEDGEESSSVPDEEDDTQAIIEQLSAIQAPEVSEITSRSALLQWSPPPSPENAPLNFNINDLRYEVLLSVRIKEAKYKSIFKGTSLSCWIHDLSPKQEYYVCLKVYLQELKGSAADLTIFTTLPCEPDQPAPPKLIVRTKNSLQLRWNAPTDNGSPIIHYILEYTDDETDDNFVEATKTKGKQFALSKLQPSTKYRLRLAAYNKCGRSVYSNIVAFTTASNPPPTPQPPVLEGVTSSTIRLAWQRYSPDEEYVLQMNKVNSNYGYLAVYNGRDTMYECSNLERASPFQFRLRAERDTSGSQWSEEVVFNTLPERPGRPPKPTVKGKIHATYFRLKWEPPTDRGGADIKLYHLEISSGAGFERIYSGPETEAVCDRLSPGTTYQTRLICEGPGGISTHSDPSTITTEAVAPGPPSKPFCSSPPGPYAAVLKWERPGYNGGAPVIEYELEIESTISDTPSKYNAYKGKDSYCVVKDLLPGNDYTVQVKAINRIGGGSWSGPFTFTSGAAPPIQPEVPQIFIRSPTHLNIVWKEPQTNGAPISEYRLENSTTENNDEFFNICFTGTQTHADVKNLNPFTIYYFRMCASNVAGTSPFSDIVSIKTPAAAPCAPTIDLFEILPTDINLTWKPSECNGSPILYYNVECGDRLISTVENVTEFSINDLCPETTYKVKIQAVNEIGTGPFSTSIKITTLPMPPVAPHLECTGIGHNFLKLKWGEGKNVNFTRFYIEMFNQRSKEFHQVYSGTSYICKINKLNEMTTYVFRICAETDYAGIGDFSSDYTFKTCAALPNNIKAPRICETNVTSNQHSNPSASTSTSPVTNCGSSSCITIEWQHSKNPFTDKVEYILQSTKAKHQEFQEIYRGPDTRYTIENLEAGYEYMLRVCPIRIQSSGEILMGAYSPVLRHQMIKSRNGNDINLINGANTSDLVDTINGANSGNISGNGVKKILGKLYASRKKLTDTQMATCIAISILVITFIFTSILQIIIG